ARVRERVRAASAGATVVIVSQRISTVSGAELIVVLDDGLVVGAGTHDELLETCATYREFADSQSVSAGER
ncbi:ABC transporter ATP-binding protein, partial [Mycobacterium sp. ITM-2017-0098]